MRTALMIIILGFTFLLPARTISIKEAKEIAIKNNFEYLSELAELKKKENSLKQSYASFFPDASLSSSLTYYTPEVEMLPGSENKEYTTDLSVSVSQPIYQGGKITNGVKLSKLELEMQKNDVLKSKKSILQEVETKYYDLLESKKFVEFSKEQVVKSKEDEKNAKIKFDLDVITKSEYLQSKADLAETEVDYLSSANNFQISMIEFQNYLKIEDDDNNNYDDEIKIISVTSTEYDILIDKLSNYTSNDISLLYHKLKKYATNNNLELKNISLLSSINEISLDNAKGNFLPQVSLGYMYSLSKDNYDDDFSGQGNLQLKASIPIFPIYDNYLSVENSKLDIKKNSYSSEINRDQIMLGLKRDLYNLVTSVKKYQTAIISREAAKESYLQTKILFENGSTDLINLLNNKAIYTNAENSHTSYFFNILQDLQDLTYNAGYDSEKELINMIFEK